MSRSAENRKLLGLEFPKQQKNASQEQMLGQAQGMIMGMGMPGMTPSMIPIMPAMMPTMMPTMMMQQPAMMGMQPAMTMPMMQGMNGMQMQSGSQQVVGISSSSSAQTEDEDDDNDPSKRSEKLPMQGNQTTYNINNLLFNNIMENDYFKALYQLRTYHEVIDEVYRSVKHIEPWQTDERITSYIRLCQCSRHRFFNTQVCITTG